MGDFFFAEVKSFYLTILIIFETCKIIFYIVCNIILLYCLFFYIFKKKYHFILFSLIVLFKIEL